MIGSVGKGVWRQMGEARRHMGKVGYADRDNDTVCGDRLTVIQPQEKAMGRPVQRDDCSILYVWNKLPLKGEPVRRERFEWHWSVDVLGWKAIFYAETL